MLRFFCKLKFKNDFLSELRTVRSRLEDEQRARQRIEHELDQHNEKVSKRYIKKFLSYILVMLLDQHNVKVSKTI